jgi:predicted SAM-dependent methyltransferase
LAVAARVGPAVVGCGGGLDEGSGVVVAPGRVLTDAHNVRGVEVIVSFSDGRHESGAVIETDPLLGMAAVQVDTGDVQPVEWQPESVGVAIGTPVVALANRGGRDLRAMLGFISSTDRDVRLRPGGRTIPGCIEHNAPMPGGSGGGPLVDLDGRLLGLNKTRQPDGLIGAIRAGEDFAIRAERLWRGEGARNARRGFRLGMGLAHPMFERIEALEEQPPYDRALMERLGQNRLHVGCGRNIVCDWLNADLRILADEDGSESPPGRIVRGTAAGQRERYFLSHDALDPFPIEDGAFDVVYSEHFIEHLPREAGIDWLREVRRLLRPGGFLRLSTPDLRKYVDGYLDPAGSFFAAHRQAIAPMTQFRDSGVPATRGFMMNQIFRFYHHQWVYDLEEVRAAAAGAGFDPDAVTECSFQQGRLPEVAKMDQPARADESLYAEIART